MNGACALNCPDRNMRGYALFYLWLHHPILAASFLQMTQSDNKEAKSVHDFPIGILKGLPHVLVDM
jgi:hypothetical protein